jgi:hypothetical protein
MQSIEQHRRTLAKRGIEPDCMPDEYWQRYAAKRRAFKLTQGKPQKQNGGCDCCRLNTDEVL